MLLGALVAGQAHGRPTPSNNILRSREVTIGVTQINGIPRFNRIIELSCLFESLSRHQKNSNKIIIL